MTLFTAFREALRDFVRSPVRSFIVLQGVIWGTAIGIFPPALINGSRRAALEKASELGTDRVLVVDSSIVKRGFDWELAARVRKDFSGQVRAGAAFAHREVEIDGKKRIALLVDSGALEVRRYRLAEGAWLTAEEIAAGAPVAVLEAKAAQELFPPAKGGSALGATIHLDDGLPPVKVVGVTAPLPPSFLDRDVFGYEKSHWLHGLVEDIKDSFGIASGDVDWLSTEDKIIVPHRRYPDGQAEVLELRSDPREVPNLGRRVREMLLTLGSDTVVYTNPVVQFLFSDQLDMLEKIHWVVFLACVLVGTVIVASLRVLTVMDRREEIAIRRVEGATLLDIGCQFTLETAVFCLLGTVAGVPLGIFLAWLRAQVDPSSAITWVFPLKEAVVTAATLCCMSILAGIVPAVRAVRVQPVEILGKE